MFGRRQSDCYILDENEPRKSNTQKPTATGANHEEWKSFFTAVSVEALCFMTLLGGLPSFGHPHKPIETKPPPTRVTTLVFRPAAGQQPPPASAIRSAPTVPVIPSGHSGIKVDMTTIQISVADDSSDQITKVLSQQGGMLGFLEASDPSIALYTFRPPEWRMQNQMVDVSGQMRFSMKPPSRWPLLQSLASSNGIAMDRFEVDALFDRKFAGCLQQEIQKTAARTGTGRVRAATLAFTAEGRCGINVLNVEFALVR